MSDITFVDLETELMAPGYRLPMPAIATTWNRRDGARLWLTHELPELWDRLLSDDTTAIGGHNLAAFDCPVTAAHMPWLRPKLWRKLEAGQIVDTLVCERIIQINRGARGELGLGAIAPKYGIPFTDKDDPAIKAIRLSFGQFIGAREIPAEHAKYALDDATVLPTLFERQWSSGLISWNDQAMLSRQLFWQALCSARGFRTDLDHVRKLDAMVSERIADLEEIARACGFLRKPGKDGKSARNMKAIHEALAAAYAPVQSEELKAARELALIADMGGDASQIEYARDRLERATAAFWAAVPRTEPSSRHPHGQVKSDRLTLEDVPGTDLPSERLRALSEWSQLLSVRNKDLVKFYQAAIEPCHTQFGIADTTRSTSRDPNIQNWGKLRGVRECIAARPGYALAVSDFKQLELLSLAQICVERLGLTEMASKLSAGIDLYADIVGVDILQCSYDELIARRAAGDKAADEARDCGKPAVLGMNGGMQSAETFQLYARKGYGQKLSLEQCERIMASWRNRAVDQQAYLRAIKQTRNELGLYDLKHPRFENLYRRGLRFTEAANNPFQILGMRVADRAGWLVTKAQYCPTPDADMSGSHLVMFVHDDLTSEVPLDKTHEHAMLQERLMCQASREICPDVFTGVDTKVSTHLSKSAKAKHDETGRLAVTSVSMPDSLSKAKK